MNSDAAGWEPVFVTYRSAQIELRRWKDYRRTQSGNFDWDFYIDEMEDILLDLKQAYLDQDRVRATESIAEVLLIFAELRDRLSGES